MSFAPGRSFSSHPRPMGPPGRSSSSGGIPSIPILGGGILPSTSLLSVISEVMTTEAILGGGPGSLANVYIADAEPSSRVVFESYKPGEEKWEDKHTKTKCKICMEDDKVVQCVFEPCGHACACRSCSEKLLAKRGKCPICNTRTTGCFKYRKQILVQDDYDEDDKEDEKVGVRTRGGEKKRTRRDKK